MGISLLPSFKGTYQLVPPPGAKVGGWGLKKLKRGLKKAGRGVKKAGKGGLKVAKKGAKVTVKVHTKALKTAAKLSKFALKAAAKLAAKPIIKIVNQLAARRGKFLAYQRTGNPAMSLADKKAGGQYALNKLRKAGPLGVFAIKVLKYTGGVTAGEVLGATLTKNTDFRRDMATCGVAPAAIAAAALSIVQSVKGIMKVLNRPGEAPADPTAGGKPAEDSEEVQPVVESDDSPNEETAEEAPEETAEEGEEGATEGTTLEEQYDAAEEAGNRALMKKIATKIRRRDAGRF